MLSTFVSELTSLVNSDSAWKVSKGRRSASRRNRNIVRKGTENCASVILSNPERSNMPVTESEKRGISVLGCTFNDKVEHLPIKKRRSLLRNSSSPPPPPSSPARHDISVSATDETADIPKNQDASNELEINPSHITDNNISSDAKKYIKSSEILGCDEDFSGISILAAAACSNNSSGKECGYAEEHSCVEECSIQEQFNETCIKTKESCFSDGLVTDDLIVSHEILRGGALSCVSVEPVGELLSLSTSVSSLQNLETVEKRVEVAISRDVLCSNDEEIEGKRCLSSRDDRLHWDLNVMMDDWEQSFEDSVAHNEVPHNKSDDCENGNNLCDLALDIKSSLSCAPCELEKIRSDSPFGNASAGIQTHFCNSSDTDTNKEVTPHLAGMDNVEASPTLQDEETSASIEKTDSKTNEIVSEISLLKVELTDYDDESSKYEAVTTSDNMKDASVKTCEIAPDDHEIQEQVTSKEICDSLFSDSCKANTDNNNNNNLCFSDKIGTIDGAHLDCHSASVVRASSPSRLHEGYDSQYEDGELRETNECEWNEYCGGNDTEHMVCEQDMETCSVSPVHFRVPESGQVDIETNVVMEVISTIPSSVNNFENEGSTKAAVCEGEVKNEMNSNSNSLTEEKADATRSEQSREISRSSLERVEVGDGNEENVAILSGGDVLVDCGGIDTKIEAKSYKRGLRSQIEAPVLAQDGSCRDERSDKVENRYEETSCMRSSERIRYPLHGQGRGRDLKNWNGSFDGRRGFKRRYSPIYHGRLKGDDDGITERDDIACIDSPNDSSYALHSRCRPQRKFSPENNRPSTFGRDRPFRYGPSTGGRGRYNNGPPSKDEIFQSSLKYRRPLSHRERSPSPFGVRAPPNAYHSRGKSPSRSRSRSPLMWAPQRGRPGGGGGNTFIRHRSRSPNFRSEVRVQQRTRSPIHHQPGFTGERTLGFRSFPRNNYNSPPHSRWASARKDESGHFRDFGCKQQRSFTLERSPGRNIKRTDRVIDSLRNMKPDGYYRISEEGGGREFRYEENYEERRKHYGTTTTTTTTTTLCPNRRNFDDGMNNRLHQDMNDGFSGSNIRDRDTTSGFQGRGVRGMGCRIGDLPRVREGKFNSDSKQFIPDVMDSSSDMPSEEPFHSQQGRFPVVEGPSRGRRYENYEDRRKQYGGGVFTEKRTNHFFDRNFEDGSFYPRRSVRNFDGQVGSLATRLGEQHESVMSRKEEKLEENAQSFGGGNSDEHDMAKGRVSSLT